MWVSRTITDSTDCKSWVSCCTAGLMVKAAPDSIQQYSAGLQIAAAVQHKAVNTLPALITTDVQPHPCRCTSDGRLVIQSQHCFIPVAKPASLGAYPTKVAGHASRHPTQLLLLKNMLQIVKESNISNGIQPCFATTPVPDLLTFMPWMK